MSDRRPSPPPVQAPSAEQMAWTVHLRAVRALRALVLPCAREGIALLPVKGILTGPLLYGDTARRPMRDCDVRLRPRDLERTLRIARREGFALEHRIRAYRSAVVVQGGVQLDLETAVGPPGLCDLRVEEMLLRARPSDLLGFPHLVPERADHALLLCVNVFKDKLGLAGEDQLEDLRRIVRAPSFGGAAGNQGAFDGAAFVRRVRESGATSLVWIVADYMHTERGDETWGAVARALDVPGSRGRYRRYLAKLERGQPRRERLRLLSRLAADRPASRVEAALRMGLWGLERLL